MRDIQVPWSVVREGIHLAYEYIQGEPHQFDYICNLSDDDLLLLESHVLLQRHYEIDAPKGDLDWSTIYKLILIEQDYRKGLEHDY